MDEMYDSLLFYGKDYHENPKSLSLPKSLPECSIPEYDESLALNPLCDKLSKYFAFEKMRLSESPVASG